MLGGRVDLRWLALAAFVAACATASPPTTTPSRFVAERGADRLVVFVHGIAGDAVDTWRNPATGAYWPELLASDPAMVGFDVYVVGFASPLVSRASTIEEIAQRVLQQFRDRGFFSRYRQIHFVTHSMGGLVTKRLLNDLNRPAEAETLRRVRTVVLISTPSLGAPIAELASLLSLNPQTRDMAPADLNTFLQGLENQWQTLLRDRDTAGLAFPRTYCAYETRPTAGVMVVSRVYASTRCDATPYPLDLEHSAIVKPASREVDPYPWVRTRLLETAALPADRVTGGPRDFYWTVQLYSVVRDGRGPLFASQRFTVTGARALPDATIAEAARWINGELGARYRLDRSTASVTLHVPPDPAHEPIRVESVPSAQVTLYLVDAGRKARVQASPEVLAALRRDFDLEIAIPGYGTRLRRIVWGQAVDESFTIESGGLAIGVETLEGDPSLAVRLTDALSADRRLVIRPPSMLVDLRRQIAENMALLARNPAVQLSLRTDLGIEVLVSGQVEER